MKEINLMLLGPGQVGKKFIEYFKNNKEKLATKYELDLNFVGIFDSKSGIVNLKGINLDTFKSEMSNEIDPISFVQKVNKPLVAIDTSASLETYKVMDEVLKHDGFVVMSNKKPLSEDINIFDSLYTKYGNRLYFETTVGAGLPIISTIQELMDTGDEILNISGCFSGTLGYIFSLLQEGKNFSDAILEAKNMGYTEPDPRDDLSGLDVARKGLILNRLMGGRISLTDIELPSLYLADMNKLSVERFCLDVSSLNGKYKELVNEATGKGQVIKYVVDVNKDTCKIGVRNIDSKSDIGGLNGPDNICVIKTRRYNKNPLVIKGPGAGLDVTATGVFGDLVKIVKILSI